MSEASDFLVSSGGCLICRGRTKMCLSCHGRAWNYINKAPKRQVTKDRWGPRGGGGS